VAVLSGRRGGRRRILVVENEEGGRPAQLGDAAEAAGLELDVRSAGRDPIPDRLGDAAGLAVLGASYDVRDAERFPHLYRVMDLIREAAATDRPALGICLGGQLAAEALGGSVERGANGPEIGWMTVRAAEEGAGDPLASAVGDGTPLLLWHHDVFTPPPGSVRVLTSDGYPDQGFRLGTVWGIQPHPEADPEVLAEWCSSPGGAADLDANGVSPEDLLGRAPEHSARARRLLDAWCLVAADETHASAGPATEEHLPVPPSGERAGPV
jgi:GMP synthase (glutamine-hydrolysing)